MDQCLSSASADPLLRAQQRTPAGGSSRFATSLLDKKVTPVTLPPGLFIPATRPTSTGSTPVTKTMGMVEVAALAA